MKKITKKAQSGVKVDKTAVSKPKGTVSVKNQPTYNRLSSNATAKDSAEYKKGYDFGKKQPNNNLQHLVEGPVWRRGEAEGANDKRPQKKIKLKSGGKIIKKK